MPRPWIRLDVELLNDERFEQLNPEQGWAWVKAYLIMAREGDSIRDLARLTRLLTKEGIPHAAQRVEELDRMDWFVASSRAEASVTLRGFEAHQPSYRGPSDTPEAKAIRNRNRRRGASRSDGERAGATQYGTVQNGTGVPGGQAVQPPAPADENVKDIESLGSVLQGILARPAPVKAKMGA